MNQFGFVSTATITRGAHCPLDAGSSHSSHHRQSWLSQLSFASFCRWVIDMSPFLSASSAFMPINQISRRYSDILLHACGTSRIDKTRNNMQVWVIAAHGMTNLRMIGEYFLDFLCKETVQIYDIETARAVTDVHHSTTNTSALCFMAPETGSWYIYSTGISQYLKPALIPNSWWNIIPIPLEMHYSRAMFCITDMRLPVLLLLPRSSTFLWQSPRRK